MTRSLLGLSIAFLVAASGCAGCANTTVLVTPSTLVVNAGSAASTFTATVAGGTDTVSWSLSSPVGSLSTSSGTSTQYTPPANLAATTVVTLTAKLSGSGKTGNAVITVNPVGSLEVNITNPGSGTGTPSVTVTGPGSYTKALQATTLLNSLPVGSYVITSAPLKTPDSIVSIEYLPIISGSPASVSGGNTADASVAYATEGGSGMLWIPLSGGSQIPNVAAFSATQLSPSGVLNINPSLAFTVDGGSSQSIAFDPSGNLWVSDSNNNQLLAYTPDQLVLGAAATPFIIIADVILDAGIGDAGIRFLDSVEGLAFDKSGDLWVANSGDFNQVNHYTSNQLLASGSIIPSATLFSVDFDAGMDAGPSSLPAPFDVAFDSSGNLWVANYSGSKANVVEFKNPKQYAGFVSPTPDTLLRTQGWDGGQSMQSNGLAFDPDGGLWVANWSSSTITKFNVSGLPQFSQPVPEVTLFDHAISLPDGGTQSLLRTTANIVFDNSGAMWVISNGSGALSRFASPGSWQGFVSPEPSVTVLGFEGQANSGRMAFDPAPANVPLAH